MVVRTPPAMGANFLAAHTLQNEHRTESLCSELPQESEHFAQGTVVPPNGVPPFTKTAQAIWKIQTIHFPRRKREKKAKM